MYATCEVTFRSDTGLRCGVGATELDQHSISSDDLNARITVNLYNREHHSDAMTFSPASSVAAGVALSSVDSVFIFSSVVVVFVVFDVNFICGLDDDAAPDKHTLYVDQSETRWSSCDL